jgi:hypothetical protein
MGRGPVYDLSVDGAAEFVASGVLVHNCLRYFCWLHRRHLWQAGAASSYLEIDVATEHGFVGRNWLEAVRLQLLPRRYQGSSYLEIA